jgi:hypothetical protein
MYSRYDDLCYDKGSCSTQRDLHSRILYSNILLSKNYHKGQARVYAMAVKTHTVAGIVATEIHWNI